MNHVLFEEREKFLEFTLKLLSWAVVSSKHTLLILNITIPILRMVEGAFAW